MLFRQSTEFSCRFSQNDEGNLGYGGVGRARPSLQPEFDSRSGRARVTRRCAERATASMLSALQCRLLLPLRSSRALLGPRFAEYAGARLRARKLGLASTVLIILRQLFMAVFFSSSVV